MKKSETVEGIIADAVNRIAALLQSAAPKVKGKPGPKPKKVVAKKVKGKPGPKPKDGRKNRTDKVPVTKAGDEITVDAIYAAIESASGEVPAGLTLEQICEAFNVRKTSRKTLAKLVRSLPELEKSGVARGTRYVSVRGDDEGDSGDIGEQEDERGRTGEED